MNLNLEQRKRPIGKLPLADSYAPAYLEESIDYISNFGIHMESFFNQLSPEDYQKQYRPGSWTIQELIHHLAESHMIHFSRIKLCLSLNHPSVNPFPENEWVKQSDVQEVDPAYSILMLKGIQKRMGHLLSTLSPSKRKEATLFNPEPNRTFTIEDLLVINAWHGRHHLAQLDIALNYPA